MSTLKIVRYNKDVNKLYRQLHDVTKSEKLNTFFHEPFNIMIFDCYLSGKTLTAIAQEHNLSIDACNEILRRYFYYYQRKIEHPEDNLQYLELERRVWRVIKRMGFYSIDDIKKYLDSGGNFKNIRGLGLKSRQDIIDAVNRYYS